MLRHLFCCLTAIAVCGSAFVASAAAEASDVILLVDTSVSMPLGDSDNIARLFQADLRKRWAELRAEFALEKLQEAELLQAPPTWKTWLEPVHGKSAAFRRHYKEFRQREFRRLTTELSALVRNLAPQTQVTLIPFAGHAKPPIRADLSVAEEKAKLLAAIAALESDEKDTFTALALAIQSIVAELDRLRTLNPDRVRHVVLITDGADTPATVDDLLSARLEHIQKGLSDRGLRVRNDFFLWYGHIGPVAPDVAASVEKLGGQAVAIDRLRFGHLSFNRPVVDLGKIEPADGWQREFPSREARDLGDVFTVAGRNCDQLEVQIGPHIDWEMTPEAAQAAADGPLARLQIAVEPSPVMIGPPQSQQVVLKFRGERLPPGIYRGRIRLASKGHFATITPPFLRVAFTVPEPTLAIQPERVAQVGGESLVDLGRVDLTHPVEATFRLALNEEAKPSAGFRPRLKVGVELDEFPAGLELLWGPPGKQQPLPPFRNATNFRAIEDYPVEAEVALLTARLRPGQAAPPGLYSGRIVVQGQDGLKVTASRFPLELRIAPLKLPVGPIDPEVPWDERGNFQLTVPFVVDGLPPNYRVPIRALPPGAGAADSPVLELTEAAGEVSRTAPTVALRGRATPWRPGAWKFALPLVSDDPLIVPTPPVVEFRVQGKRSNLTLGQVSFVERIVLTERATEPLPLKFVAPLDPQAWPGQTLLNVRLGPPRLVESMADPADQRPATELRLTQTEIRGLSRDDPRIVVAATLPAAKPGHWRFRIPVVSASEGVAIAPDYLEVTLQIEEAAAPPPGRWLRRPAGFITAATRYWPFEYLIVLPSQSGDEAADFEFKLTFPGEIAVESVVRAAEKSELGPQEGRGVVAVAPVALPELHALAAPADGSPPLVRFQLRLRSATPAAQKEWQWSLPVRVVPQYLQPLELFVMADGTEPRRKLADNPAALQAPPLRVDGEAAVRVANELNLRVAKRAVVIDTEFPSDDTHGTPEQVRDWRAALQAKPNGRFRTLVLESGDVTQPLEKLIDEAVPERAWWESVPVKTVRYGIIPMVQYEADAGASPALLEEWGDVRIVVVNGEGLCSIVCLVVTFLLVVLAFFLLWLLWWLWMRGVVMRRLHAFVARVQREYGFQVAFGPGGERQEEALLDDAAADNAWEYFLDTFFWLRKIKSVDLVTKATDPETSRYDYYPKARQRLQISSSLGGFAVRCSHPLELRPITDDGYEPLPGQLCQANTWCSIDGYASGVELDNGVICALKFQVPDVNKAGGEQIEPGEVRLLWRYSSSAVASPSPEAADAGPPPDEPPAANPAAVLPPREPSGNGHAGVPPPAAAPAAADDDRLF